MHHDPDWGAVPLIHSGVKSKYYQAVTEILVANIRSRISTVTEKRLLEKTSLALIGIDIRVKVLKIY